VKEIGSEFWDVPASDAQNDLFPESTQWFLSGRSALHAIIKELPGCRTVALPSWCCDSVIKPFVDAGMKISFYPVYWDGRLVQEISFDSDVLFLMNYFGYFSPAPDLSAYKGIVIRDVTHSIFSESYSDADYYFGSLRKWCGVLTGGYVWADDGHKLTLEHSDDFGYTLLRGKAIQLKNSFINGYVDAQGNRVTDKGYLKIFDAAEEVLENIGIAPAAERDVTLAKQLDVEFIKTRHRANAEVLRTAFPDWLIFPEMSASDCPMFAPILVPDGKRNELRRFLINNNIYCPTHWPVSEYHQLDERMETIYQNELSLVCDQRYTEDDMFRMVETIKAFVEV